MFSQSFRQTAAAAALLLGATFVAAQDQEPALKITGRGFEKKQYQRNTYVFGIGAFDSNSSGFYRLNASLASSAGAPIVSNVTRLAKKLIEVSGEGFTSRSLVEVNGIARATTVIDSQTLRAKVKAKAGNVVPVSNPPDERRPNPLLVQ